MDQPEKRNCSEIVQGIINSDEGAEHELVRRFRNAVLALIHQETRGHHIDEDLCQETFLITIQRIRQGRLRNPESLPGFIKQLAKNLVVSYFRKWPRNRNLELPPNEEWAAPQLDPALEFARIETSTIIRQVLNELSNRDREALYRLHILEEDKSLIRRDLDLTPAQFNMVIHRARRRFAELYSKAVGPAPKRRSKPVS